MILNSRALSTPSASCSHSVRRSTSIASSATSSGSGSPETRKSMRSDEPPVVDQRCVERGVGRRQTRIHHRDVGDRDAERGRDLLIDRGAGQHFGALRQPGAQPSQIEEQRLLRRAGAAAHDRPVAQDVVLDGGPDPPRRIGGEAHLALRLEAGGGLQQADMPFLDQVAERQPEMPELCRPSR